MKAVTYQSECLYCKGTGMVDEHNRCGFCYPDRDDYPWIGGPDAAYHQHNAMRAEVERLRGELVEAYATVRFLQDLNRIRVSRLLPIPCTRPDDTGTT